MKKTILGGLVLGIMTSIFAGVVLFNNTSVNTAQATVLQEVEQCGHETTYTDSSSDNHFRVNVNFNDYLGDDDREVIVTPAVGYKLVSIGIDYTGTDANEANPSVGDGLSAVTYQAPNNESIDHVTVKVSKVCTEVCNDDSATNYQSLTPGQTVANNSLCEYPPVDVCTNVAGNQSTTPDNMTNEQGYCDCQVGYHRDYGELYLEAGDGDSFRCVENTPDPSPTPPPSSTPTPEQGLSPAGAPICPDVSPTRVPANFHMYRGKSDQGVSQAIVKWLPDVNNKEGNEVTIYYGVSGFGMQHSVNVPNNGYAVINLYSDMDFDFWGQVRNGCGGGPLTKVVVDGATNGWVLFTQAL